MKFLSTILAVLAFGLLTGCFESGQETVRFKVIAEATVDGKKVSASSVMEVTWKKQGWQLLGRGGSTSIKGEALVLDLGDRGKLFVLPWMQTGDAGFRPFYEKALLSTFGIKNRVERLSEQDFALLRGFKPGQVFKPVYRDVMLKKDVGAMMVFFGDLADPATVVEVTPDNFAKVFGKGASFSGIKVEISDEPVTRQSVIKHLPLLKDRKRRWSQRPLGKHKTLDVPEMSKRPLNWRMGPSLFYAPGNK